MYVVVKSSDLSLPTTLHNLNETFHPLDLSMSYSSTLADRVINEAKFASLFFSDLFRYYVIEVIILKTFDETETHYQNRLICLAVYFVGFLSIIIRISSLRKTNKVVLYDVYSVASYWIRARCRT